MNAKMDEQQYWKKWQTNRDPEAGDVLIQKYKPLVSYHAQRIGSGLPKSVSKDDLFSLGMMGLFDALNKFDPSRELKFDTYASFRVRGAIMDGLRREDWLPRSSRDRAKKLEASIEELEQKLMRHATPEEVAAYAEISVAEVHTAIQENFFSNVLSTDDRKDDDEDKSYAVRDTASQTPEERIMKDELIAELSGQIKTLTEKEQLVLSLFYTEDLTLTEIGEILGLSTSRISQIHSKALFKLRKQLSAIDKV
ncbi:FliA/WhiG family RNA polymerase sigma factor [Indiicoccus explosivorum]|uniref:FliA/WhiG family RNA polymerase sigma factor n=1 Tax=Indiicoccus explosivorum TaxID=1917864 RepID=UPI000B431D96|nr:FliA/WhiG family RNA polymerase sigma factor [Indiicoccus explosivorum]